MNLQALATHTIDVDLLPEAPVVLDVGCRWFDFTKAILALRPKARVIALDPSSDVRWEMDLPLFQVQLFHMAMVGDNRFSSNFAEGIAGDGGGNFCLDAALHGDYKIRTVLCTNVQKLMAAHLVKRFDVVKLDCEGSEFGILENWPGPVATQISVEFHDWDKPQYKAETYFDALWRKLPWYKVLQHELSKQGTGVGHWDSLLVLEK